MYDEPVDRIFTQYHTFNGYISSAILAIKNFIKTIQKNYLVAEILKCP